jgi:hypothetical protein
MRNGLILIVAMALFSTVGCATVIEGTNLTKLPIFDVTAVNDHWNAITGIENARRDFITGLMMLSQEPTDKQKKCLQSANDAAIYWNAAAIVALYNHLWNVGDDAAKNAMEEIKKGELCVSAQET